MINFLWKLILVLSTLGITTAIARHIYKKFYIQRRCKLLIIGEPYSGKTALLMNLVNPKIAKEEILKLTGRTPAEIRKVRESFIPEVNLKFIHRFLMFRVIFLEQFGINFSRTIVM